MAATYDDFYQSALSAGMLDSFSGEDLALAKKYPSFGMSILSLKKEYASASTPQQKALINQTANELRQSYGGYTGGTDGISVVYSGLSPASYQGAYADTISSLLGQAASYGDFSYGSAPSYTNPYASQQNVLLAKLTDRQPFSYDVDSDPAYSAYKKEYNREGQRAAANALAQSAAATAGIPSSYAVTAASQAGDYYAAQLADKVPELYKAAYQRYLDEAGLTREDLESVNQLQQLDYDAYLTRLEQYNKDRAFAYEDYADRYDRILQNLAAYQEADNIAYDRVLDQIAYNRNQALDAREAENDAKTLALNLWKTAGYADSDVAAALGLTEGQATAAQLKQNASAAKKSTGTKKTEDQSTVQEEVSARYDQVWDHACQMFMEGADQQTIDRYLQSRYKDGWITAGELDTIKAIL